MNKAFIKSLIVWSLASLFLIVVALYFDFRLEKMGGHSKFLRFVVQSLLVISGLGIITQVFRWARRTDLEMKSLNSNIGDRCIRPIASAENLFATIVTWAEQMNYEKHESSTSDHLVFVSRKFSLYPIFVAANRTAAAAQMEAWVQFGNFSVPIRTGFSYHGSMRDGRKHVNTLLAQLGERPLR